MIGPTLQELDDLDSEPLECDVDHCRRPAKYLIVWTSHLKVACERCGIELSDQPWPDAERVFQGPRSSAHHLTASQV